MLSVILLVHLVVAHISSMNVNTVLKTVQRSTDFLLDYNTLFLLFWISAFFSCSRSSLHLDPLAASPTMFEGFNRKSKAAQEAESKKDHSSPKPTGSGKGSSKAATKKPTKPTLIHPKEIVAKVW